MGQLLLLGAEVGRGKIVLSPGPDVDEAAEGEVGDEVGGGEGDHGGRARGVPGVESVLDRPAIVGDAGAEADGGAHDLEGDWAAEEGGGLDFEAELLAESL
ncbi:uncharacterized protein A4U43_C04F7500 [Asparagus officinalis]|uniref:Uncharacterized protein n=1 Tax=Asparagus officinalis TaxID=4686 RepID=A0A5P1F0U4_ASPOF|nr:uncharacterized protein A4U43_C04F7500 [Asparagus officinalis]